MHKLPEKIDSKFRYVLLASVRAEQLMRGAQPKQDRPGVKMTRTAMQEILDETVGWEYGPEEVAPEAAGDEAFQLADGAQEAAPEG